VKHCDRVVTLADAVAAEGQPWVLWIVGGLAAWVVVAFLVAVLIGKSVRMADRHAGMADDELPLTTAELPATMRAPAARARRRAIPLPPVGVALAASAVALETSGYLLRLTGSTGMTAQLLSMDAPYSLPRMFVAALFAAAAVAAVAGASTFPGRRAWWLAVGLVAGGIAAVKAGSTIHSQALHTLESVLGPRPALLVSATAATVVLAALAILTRTERRDRRRILGVLALYAGAAVGLSALSSIASRAYGGASNWTIAATFIEESGEALAGVAFLIAVLAGVAPRLVLPSAWALRRSADAQTLDLPERLPGVSAGDRPAQG
jgi:hypothetical protein